MKIRYNTILRLCGRMLTALSFIVIPYEAMLIMLSGRLFFQGRLMIGPTYSFIGSQVYLTEIAIPFFFLTLSTLACLKKKAVFDSFTLFLTGITDFAVLLIALFLHIPSLAGYADSASYTYETFSLPIRTLCFIASAMLLGGAMTLNMRFTAKLLDKLGRLSVIKKKYTIYNKKGIPEDNIKLVFFFAMISLLLGEYALYLLMLALLLGSVIRLLSIIPTTLLKKDGEMPKETPSTKKESSVEPGRFKGYTALLADPVYMNRRLGETMLRKFGLDVLTAINPADAYKLYTENNERISLIMVSSDMQSLNNMYLPQLVRELETEENKTMIILVKSDKKIAPELKNNSDVIVSSSYTEAEVFEIISKYL